MRYLLMVSFLFFSLYAQSYTLDELTECALKNDTLLQADKEVVKQYILQKEAAKKWENPELSLSYVNTKPEGFKRQDEFGVAVSQAIEKPSLRAAKLSLLDAKIIQARVLAEYKEKQIRADVRQKSYIYLVTLAIAKDANETLQLAQTFYSKGQKRFEQGMISQADLLKLHIEEQKAQHEYELTLLKLDEMMEQLLHSAHLKEDVTLLHVELPTPSEEPFLLDESRLPMLAYYRAVDDEYRAAKDIAQKSVIPGVKASVGYQEMYDQKAVITSLSVPIPIFTQNEPLIESAQSQITENHLKEESYRYDTLQELHHHEHVVQTLAKMIASQHLIVEQSQTMQEMAQKSYDAGHGTLLELIDARRVVLANKKELAMSLQSYYDILGEIQKIIPPIQDQK